MSICKKLEEFLKGNHVSYEVVDHSRTFTAQGTAKVEHVSGKVMAKVVMVKAKDKDLMVVIPAHKMLDLAKVEAKAGKDHVRMEDESEFSSLFPDCEVGAMPPFGKLYKLPCYVDRLVLEHDDVYFNGGTHAQSVKISSDDFRRLAGAEVGDFTV